MFNMNNNHIKKFKELLENSNVENNMEFLIQVYKNNRILFITKTIEFTWKKEFGWKFNSIEEVKNEIRNNRMLELTIGRNYEIIEYNDAKSH